MTSPIKGINHITLSVSNLNASIDFYQQVFEAKLLFRTKRTAYFDLADLWLALNVQENIPRNEIHQSYTHLAFTIEEQDLERMERRLQELNIPLKADRAREPGEGTSLYFRDPDGHLLELHTGDRDTRIRAYQQAMDATNSPTIELSPRDNC